MVTGEGDVPRAEIEELLRDVEAGETRAREALCQLVYTELHRRAAALMKGQPRGHTLQATALVGEAYLRLFHGSRRSWNDRKHFLLAASRAMRHVLVDYARGKARAKRSGKQVDSPLDNLIVAYEDRALDLEGLSQALKRLEQADPAMARAIELRFFGGSTAAECAQLLGMSQRTFERRWKMTRAWLYEELR